MFLSIKFKWNLELVPIETFDQFSPSSLEMREFSHFNQILLSLFEVSNAFYDNIGVSI